MKAPLSGFETALRLVFLVVVLAISIREVGGSGVIEKEVDRLYDPLSRHLTAATYRKDSEKADFQEEIRLSAEEAHIPQEHLSKIRQAWVIDHIYSRDLEKRAKAQFFNQSFGVSAVNWSRFGDKKAQGGDENIAQAVQIWKYAGQAFRADHNFSNALVMFEKCIRRVDEHESPDQWADLKHFIGACHYDLGFHMVGAAASNHLARAIDAYRASLNACPTNNLRAAALTLNNLGLALNDKSTRLTGAEAVKLLDEAIEDLRHGLGISSAPEFREEWCMIQINLGAALRDKADQNAGRRALGLYEDAISAIQRAEQGYNSSQSTKRIAAARSNLANTLIDEARHRKGPKALELLAKSTKILEEVLRTEENDRSEEWARTQLNYGNALTALAEQNEESQFIPLMNKAVSAYLAALTYYTREQLFYEFGLAENDLGVALTRLAVSGEVPAAEATNCLTRAIHAFTNSLNVYTFEYSAQDWAWTKHNLANARKDFAAFTDEPLSVALLDEAIADYRESLRVYHTNEFFQDWVNSEIDLAAAFVAKANLPHPQEPREQCTNALVGLKLVLDYVKEDESPQTWAIAQTGVGDALSVIADNSEPMIAEVCLQETAKYYHAAQRVFTKDDFPIYQEQIARGLADVERRLKHPKQ
jgi:hypothetical protein